MTQRSKLVKFCLAGVTGKMGQEVLKSLPAWTGIELVSAIASKNAGRNLREVLGNEVPDLVIGDKLVTELKAKKVDVLLDVTQPDVALIHTLSALENGVAPIIGTSGVTSEDLQKMENAAKHWKIPVLVVPNFSIGAVLGMKFAQMAAQWMPNVEIVEIHHDQKLDAPSGTALETARLVSLSRQQKSTVPETKVTKVPGVRGGKYCDVPIHSIRLKGILAQQSVLFGVPGETLEIKHSVVDRATYMKGIEISIRKIGALSGLTVGLDSILFASKTE